MSVCAHVCSVGCVFACLSVCVHLVISKCFLLQETVKHKSDSKAVE